MLQYSDSLPGGHATDNARGTRAMSDEETAISKVKPDEMSDLVKGINRSALLCDECEAEICRSDYEIVDADMIDGKIYREVWRKDKGNIIHIYGCPHAGWYDE